MFDFLKNRKKFIVFDVGSQKITSIAFKIINGRVKIISMDYQKSTGIKKNKFDDIEKLSSIIKKVFKKVGGYSKQNLIFSNITDPNLLITKKTTELQSGKLGISKKEIRKIFKKSLIESKVSGRRLIHSNPNNFILDEDNITSEPLGKICKNLKLSSLNVLVNEDHLKKLNLCFSKKKILIKNFFDSGIASALSCLKKKEKEDGVVCIDIGAETTKVVVYLNEKIIYVDNLPVAGKNVTSDICHGLQVSTEAAELAKITHGAVISPFNENVEINIDSRKKKLVSRNILFGIIKPRYDEILEIIRDNVFDNIHTRVAIKSVVLTGGGSKIFGIKDVCKNIFNRQTRIGQSEDPQSFFYNKPEFSTILGMIELVRDQKIYNHIPNYSYNKFTQIADKVDNWIEESYA